MEKHPLHTIWNDVTLKRGVQFSMTLFVLLFMGSFFAFLNVPPEIPLAYSLPWGSQQLLSKWALLLIVLSGFFITIAHTLIAGFFLKKDAVTARIMVWTCVLLLFFLLLCVATAYMRVGSLP